jgi:hypothetical protein
MRTLRFWLPVIVGFFVTPLFYFLLPYLISPGASHAGAGMGQLLVMYPIPLLTMMFAASSGDSFFMGAVAFVAFGLQFPLYGFIISYARLKESVWLKVLAGIVWLHLIIIGVFLIIFLVQAMF